jgi:hypothetical protein
MQDSKIGHHESSNKLVGQEYATQFPNRPISLTQTLKSSDNFILKKETEGIKSIFVCWLILME